MSEPISELVRAYTADIASLRAENERMKRAEPHYEGAIDILREEVSSMRQTLTANGLTIKYMRHEIEAYEAALREIRDFCNKWDDMRHASMLYALRSDIPALCNMTLPLPPVEESLAKYDEISF